MNNIVHIRHSIVPFSGIKNARSKFLQIIRATTDEYQKKSRNRRSSFINDLALSGSRLQIFRATFITALKSRSPFLIFILVIVFYFISEPLVTLCQPIFDNNKKANICCRVVLSTFLFLHRLK